MGLHLSFNIVAQVDVSSAIAYTMAAKDDSEIVIMRKAAAVSSDVFTKYLKDQIMEIIDSDKVRLGVFYCVSINKYSNSSPKML